MSYWYFLHDDKTKKIGPIKMPIWKAFLHDTIQVQ